MTEAALVVGTSRYLRSTAHSEGCTHKPVFLDYLANSRYYVPGASWFLATPDGLLPGYFVLMLMSSGACALGCFVTARRHAFSRARCLSWMTVGFLFGWVGLILMLALEEWPVRRPCAGCRRLRVVTRNTCEHCGAPHTPPAADGTEIFDEPCSDPATFRRTFSIA
jgi:hypothetical protein